MNDWRGSPIEVGSTVIYPKVSGSRAEMLEATVLEVGEKSIKVKRTNASRYGTSWWDDRPSTLTVLKNVTVVP